jgi:hypothetical protein
MSSGEAVTFGQNRPTEIAASDLAEVVLLVERSDQQGREAFLDSIRDWLVHLVKFFTVEKNTKALSTAALLLEYLLRYKSLGPYITEHVLDEDIFLPLTPETLAGFPEFQQFSELFSQPFLEYLTHLVEGKAHQKLSSAANFLLLISLGMDVQRREELSSIPSLQPRLPEKPQVVESEALTPEVELAPTSLRKRRQKKSSEVEISSGTLHWLKNYVEENSSSPSIRQSLDGHKVYGLPLLASVIDLDDAEFRYFIKDKVIVLDPQEIVDPDKRIKYVSEADALKILQLADDREIFDP